MKNIFTMDIDLELPSFEQEGDIISSTDVNILHGVEGTNPEEEDENFHAMSKYVKEVAGANDNSVDHDQSVMKGIGEDINTSPILEPYNGLEFESKEEAYSFYREYARSMGFGITIKASRRSKKSGKFIDIKIACSRFGSKRESSTTVNPRPCIKTDCRASMHMKKREDGKWFIYSFIKEHNHEFCPDDFYYAVRGRNKKSGIVAPQKKGLQLALDERDVKIMLEYFMAMQEKNSNFFYAIDLDQEKHLRSVLWVDAKARHDYGSFCDAVFFDTFYITNSFKVPFLPITGVNSHFQYILLGGAIVGDENESVFAWLMQTWLKAVGGKAPRLIITDQVKSLEEAVVDVFPDTRHCFCLWHILEKIPEKLEFTVRQNENFMDKLNKAIYQSWTDGEFEKRWWKMVDRFELNKDEWVHSLYEDRNKWVPTYMRDSVLAGMSTKSRSGGITSFFDKYLSSESTFKEFMEHYKVSAKDRYDMEAKADFETRHQKPALKSLSAIEKQASTIYTSTIFKKFQFEILGVASCQLEKESENGATIVYRVQDFEEGRDFLVAWSEPELEVLCLCHSFEYRGFICRHAILVLQISGVSCIPPKYVLKRWSRNARVGQTATKAPNRLNYRIQRFNELCKLAIKLGEEGSFSQETYDIASLALEEVLEHCVSVNRSVENYLGPNKLETHGFLDVEEDNYCRSMDKSSKKRKAIRKGKGQSESDGISIQMQDDCSEMINSRKHINENCNVPRQDIQRVECSQTPTLDAYYNSQENILGVGQLNSISLTRDGYYSQQGMQGPLPPIFARVGQCGNQQSVQGLLEGHISFKAPSIHGCFDAPNNLQDVVLEQSGSSSQAQFHQSVLKHLTR